jgi:hypothetical protein
MKKTRVVGSLVAFVLVAAAAACSSSSSAPSGGTGGGPGGGTSTGQGTVGASGGQVSTSDGALTVSIPAGALPGDTQITITEIPSPPAGAIGKAYEIGPTGTQFSSPVTFTFKYAGDDLMGNAPSSLEVAQIVGTDWIALSADAVDTSAQTASGQTMHLSPYGVHAKSNGNDDGGGSSVDATTPDDATASNDGGSATDSGGNGAGMDGGSPPDGSACGTMHLSNLGTCANPIQTQCPQGTSLSYCNNLPGTGQMGFTYYCCPPVS